jgi:hypothetical protein
MNLLPYDNRAQMFRKCSNCVTFKSDFVAAKVIRVYVYYCIINTSGNVGPLLWNWQGKWISRTVNFNKSPCLTFRQIFIRLCYEARIWSLYGVEWIEVMRNNEMGEVFKMLYLGLQGKCAESKERQSSRLSGPEYNQTYPEYVSVQCCKQVMRKAFTAT